MAVEIRGGICSIGIAMALFLSIVPSPLAAQSSRLTMQGPADNHATIRDSLGRPCLDVEAAARAQKVNPNMLDHVVSLKNNCPRTLKLQVCYSNSQACNDVDLQPSKRFDTILGSSRGVTFFRYTIKEKQKSS